jgi:hypothetical protein
MVLSFLHTNKTCLQIALKVVGGLNVIRGLLIFWLFIVKTSVWISTKKTHPKTVRFILAPINKVLKMFGLSPIDPSPPIQTFQLRSLPNPVSTRLSSISGSLIAYTRDHFLERFFLVAVIIKFLKFFNILVFLPFIFKLYRERVQLRGNNVV